MEHPIDLARRDGLNGRCRRALLIGTAFLLATFVTPAIHAQVYRWVDENGVIHLSSEKPPAGVKAERLDIKTSSTARRPSTSSTSGRSSGSNQPPPKPVSPEQAAARAQLLGQLQTRECVIALEALERKTGGTEPTSATEIRRLKQTADLNCSDDPVLRREQEEMAAKLRVANSPDCVEARNRLWEMMAPGSTTPKDTLRSQQAFVDGHCTAPVR
ncbi:MAG: DUF4124 domain-containing protein [Lysobacterales bacterium]|jgi:hypothetical protein|nr:MAG: DUF4124 domain-containing protein [Xanthomonadales bacterium]